VPSPFHLTFRAGSSASYVRFITDQELTNGLYITTDDKSVIQLFFHEWVFLLFPLSLVYTVEGVTM